MDFDMGLLGLAIAIAGIGISLGFHGDVLRIQGAPDVKKATCTAWFGIFMGAFLVALALGLALASIFLRPQLLLLPPVLLVVGCGIFLLYRARNKKL